MDKKTRDTMRINRELLEASQKEMKDIFRIMFREENNILCETNDGVRIQTSTYGQIHRRICDAAAALYAKLGAEHRYIALEMENSPEWVVAFWAILMSGNKPYLVNTRYPADLTGSILQTLDVHHIICKTGSALKGEVIDIAELAGEYPAVPEDVFENEIAFSSSTTSMNEVICFYSGLQIAEQILNFKQIVKECPQMIDHYKGRLKQLAFLPFYHVFGLFAVYFWFTFFGSTMVFLRNYASDTILKTCQRHEVTHIFAVPMLWHTVEKSVLAAAKEQGEKQYQKLLKGIKICTTLQNICPGVGAALSKRIMSQVTDKTFGRSLMFCINGGSYLRDSALQLLNGIGYNTYNGYGMSEIGITSVELGRTPKQRNRNSIGKPFRSVEYRIDENGILYVRGSSLCVRKLVNGKKVTLEDWFCTGDNMVCRDGSYYILGRQGDVVIGENGENINPDTVEKRFDIKQARAISVLGLPGEGGEELSLVVQVDPFISDERLSAIRQESYTINDSMPTATAIKKFYFTTDELIPPTSIKVSRTQVAAKIKSGAIKLTPFSEMQGTNRVDEDSPLCQEVKAIIAEVLGIDAAGIEYNAHIFYDLGATSIQYFSIITKVSERFNIGQYNQTNKYCYTAKEICEYIEKSI